MFTLKRLVRILKNHYHHLVSLFAIWYWRSPGKQLKVIGVTGTDGKTTTTTLLYHLLKSAGLRVATVTSVAAYVDDAEIDTGFHVTTPDPWMIQRLLRQMVKQKITHLVLEVTSHALDQYRVHGIPFDLAVVTNVTHEHLDYHHTYESYLQTKARLFRHASVVFLNQDDSSYPLLKTHVPKSAKLISYTASQSTAAFPSILNRFTENYNHQNAAAACRVAQYLTVKPETIASGIQNFPGVRGRMEMIPNSLGLKIIVDFAHTPNALTQALLSLRPQTQGKLIAIYGSAGLRDFSKRPIMGEIGSRLADEIILTAEDPRTENVYSIINQIKQGVEKNRGHVHTLADRQQALDFALRIARPGDTVAVFGKGHEQSMNLDGQHEIPWSDQAVLKQLIKLHSSK